MLSFDLRSIYESYQNIYEEGDGISCEMIEEIVEELIEECLEFGHNIDEAADVVEEAAIQYLMELNPYAAAGSKEARAYAKSTTATKRGEARKTAVKAAKEKVKAKVKGAAAAASIGASIAKDEARRAGRKAAHAVSSTVQKKKAEVKSGVKSLIGKGLRKAAGTVGKVAQKASSVAARLGEETQQIDEVSDRLARAARNTRDRRYNASFGDGGMSANYMKQNAKKDMLNKTLASRAARTGSKIKPVEEEVEAIQEADSVAAMRERAAKRRQQRYGNQGGGGRDDFRPYTEDDYKNPKPGYGSSTKKEEFDIFDVVLEFLQAEGIAETLQEAEWMMANLLDKEEIAIIVEAMHEDEDEDEEDEKEMKKGKKSKKEEEDEDEEEDKDIKEATYSAKAARAGKDIGKPGKAFAKIAKSAAKRYGSKERGKKVAGAVLAKLRASKG